MKNNIKHGKIRDDLPVHYRYYDAQYEYCGLSLHIERWFPVHETEYTYLVVSEDTIFNGNETRQSKPKRVLKESRKRYCYPTKKEAFKSFIKRKEWQIKHAKRSLERATEALKFTINDEAKPINYSSIIEFKI